MFRGWFSLDFNEILSYEVVVGDMYCFFNIIRMLFLFNFKIIYVSLIYNLIWYVNLEMDWYFLVNCIFIKIIIYRGFGLDNVVFFNLLLIINMIKIGNFIWILGIVINLIVKVFCVYNVKRDDFII